MSDRYLDFASTALGNRIAGVLGLPRPIPLRRGPARNARVVLSGNAGDARFQPAIARVLAAIGAIAPATADGPLEALVFDASGLATVAATARVHAFFHANLPRVATHGRIVLLAGDAAEAVDAEGSAVQRGLEGFVRSLAKEARRAITVQVLYVSHGAQDAIDTTLAFFLSDRSGFVTGQRVRVAPPTDPAARGRRTVVVTGASRGIGAAIAEALANAGAADGVTPVLIDVPSAAADLSRLAARLAGVALPLDVTAPDASERLVADARARGGYHVVVHNAGITRDRTLAKMDATRWDQVMDVNLGAPIRLTDALLAADAIPAGGRIVAVSSLSGIAGNAGQTNYALSKAGVIGWIERLARDLGPRGITANAVAPGFIETQMTAAVPFAIREAGRRMSSLGQGGQPADVAETIAWLADPASGGVNGQTVRVCGQSLLGA